MFAFNPTPELNALRRELDRAFESLPGDFLEAFLPGTRPSRQYPLVNVAEDAESVHVEALAPGLNPESIQVTVLRNQLTIAGEKIREENVRNEAYHRAERVTGKFVRTFALPAEVDASRVSAEYKAGVLRLTLPKAEAARPRRIAVTLS